MASQKDWMKTFWQLPLPLKVAIAVVFLVIIVLVNARRDDNNSVPEPTDGYLFCFWNVENLFDDANDRRGVTDEKWDNAYSSDPKLLAGKLENLSKILLGMNGGRGPDILALAEVESERAAQMLAERLNKDLPEESRYKHVEFHAVKQGRHFAPAVLTRLPVKGNRTRQVGEPHHRILEVHLEVGEKELVVVASHWTSRIGRRGGGEDPTNEAGRKKYADVIYGRFKEMYLRNPKIAFLVCGDFNDDPTDASVTEHLRAIEDRGKLEEDPNDPRLFNVAAGRDGKTFGTLLYHKHWNLFDQIAVSPALLRGDTWQCLPNTFRTIREGMTGSDGGPRPFSKEVRRELTFDREGFSDHFPVTVRLKVKE